MSQNETVLNHLKQPNASLTCMEAIDDYKIYRLSARIKDLRDAGHNIHTEFVDLSSGKRIGRYTLLPKTA